MLTLMVKHPEAVSFANAKRNTTDVTGANISLKLDDAFMLAVQDDGLYLQEFPVNSSAPLVSKETKAREIWQEIIEGAWKSAEPGVIFWDTIIRESLPDRYAEEGFQTVSTNPCGEIPLCPYDSCRLMAMNLTGYVKDSFHSEAYFDFDLFKQHVRIALRLMDDLVDLELEKINRIIEKVEKDTEPKHYKRVEHELWIKIKEKCEKGRRTGLGITGLGDMLASLGIKYGSEESITVAEQVQTTLLVEAYRSSIQLGKERGVFPVFDAEKEKGHPLINRIRRIDPELVKDMALNGRRNISMLTIAPTGSTSLLSQTTSGIEPAFRLYYSRRKKVNDAKSGKSNQHYFIDDNGDTYEEYAVFHHGFRKWLEHQGYQPDEIKTFNKKDLLRLLEESPYAEASSDQIDWRAKVKLQSALQKWVDHSISVTVNLPEDTPQAMISQIYIDAWKQGCKGITVYREGSRAGILVSEKKLDQQDFLETIPPKRPVELEAAVLRFKNNEKNWVAVVGIYHGKPYEIFTGRAEDSFSILESVDKGKVIKSKGENGKNRYDFQYLDNDGYKVTIEGLSRTFNEEYWNYAKLISGILRHGMPLKYVIEMIEDLYLDGQTLNTWRNGVKRALLQFIPDGTVPTDNACPHCKQASLVYQESCLQCSQCGYSKCG
ncbi:ribonucleoside-diphosphate reductase alpha chain [Catalinimonas alkaloidigena]|uniref:adenosylcobalamin-dependent ribonucleoside-diphosphate reductase n=1 Tax=Catalinimonas alkaloidigena TaxID=1075417 RepID=UPI002405F84A|nr:adenosylcobalamin-dependent ribonucleoside-diphosphate reductase [Catalinimonas alkaloidigena]MDF9801411.1 ribonucleoside-diphosphate reductase alpha chain [Catalinimonas alkaloidigena]